ncbi:MAG: hypothetical protein ACKUBY_00625 [Candidatus Moraniibacteriota bacterium]|jgi:hypothetical protein
MEMFTPDEIEKKKREPITNEEKQEIIKNARELEKSEQERSGEDVVDEYVLKGIQKNNEKLVREDHEIK